jgi:hypothetical protein
LTRFVQRGVELLSRVRHRPVLLGVLVAAPVFAPDTALAETNFVVDTSLEAGIATNPFQTAAPAKSSAVISASINPEFEIRDARGSYTLRGRFRHEEYLRRYRSSQDYGVSFGMDRALDERIQFSGRLGLDSSIVGNNDVFFGAVPGGELEPNLPPILDDVTLNGVRQRQESISAATSLVHRPSERDELTLSHSGSIARFPGVANRPGVPNRDEYNYFSQRLGYYRRLDANLSVGGALAVGKTDYRGSVLGDGRIVTPQATARLRFGPRWTVNVAAGATFTRTETILGRRSQTGLSGSVDACYTVARSGFCLNADRQAVPSSFDGIRTQTAVSANYNYRLSERTDIGARASYSRASQPIAGTGSTIETIALGLNYSRRISRQLSAFAAGGYGDTFEPGAGRRANATITGGIRFTFGDRR